MSGAARITILGGSSAFTPALAAALAARAAELPELDLVLLGRNAARAAAVARCCESVAQASGAPHGYRGSADLDHAVDGAAVLVNQVRCGGWAGREHDERFALSLGLPGDETVGPGGLSSALRTVPVVRQLARRCAARAPGVPFLNMTNPLGVVVAALADIPDVQPFGLCELPGETLRRALALLGLTPDMVQATWLGLNHQGFWTKLENCGRDLLPDLANAIAALGSEHFFGVDGQVVAALHALPVHYMELYHHTTRVARRQTAHPTGRGSQLAQLASDLHATYAAGQPSGLPAELAQRPMPWFTEALVPALVGLLGGPQQRLAVSVPNHTDHAASTRPTSHSVAANRSNAGNVLVPGLPSDMVVEILAPVGQGGPELRPQAPNERADLLAFLARLGAFERAALVAADAPSASTVRAALELHPLDFDAATVAALVPGVLAGREPAALACTSSTWHA